MKFFRKVLGSLYIHDLASDKVFNEQLIDATPYGDAVVADDPVFTDSEGKDNVLQFKIPGLLEYKDGSYKKIKNIKYKGREYTKGVKLEQEKLKNKIAFNAGIFEVKRADRDYTCQMQLASDVSVKTKDKSALNIMCKYYDKYGDNKNFDSVKEYLDIFLTGNIPEETQEILKNVEYSEPDVINLSSRLSFSESQIQNILEAKDDEIYSLISYLLFGPKAKNVFAKKYHRQWRQANLKTRDRRDNHKLSTLNSCSELLVQLGITEKKELLYDKFEGLVGKGRGLRDFEHYRCYSYFLLAKNTVKAISKLQVSARSENRLNRFLDIFQDLERVDFVQAVLTALGGGLNFDSVRYTIFLSSPHLEETLSLTNGDPYIVEDPRLQKSLKAQMRNEMNPRIRKVTFEYDTCQKDIIKAQVDLRYPLSDPSKFYAKFTLTDFSVIKDEFIHEEELNFDSQAERLKDEEGNYTNNYSFRIQLEEKLNEKSAHNMYVELVNQDNYRVSRELKIFNKKIISILSEIKERFKDTGDGIKDKALRAKDEIKDKASRIKDKVSNIQ